MAVEISTIGVGFETLNKSLASMAGGDERGRKWMRDSFMRTGREAFKHVVFAAKAKAPVGETGLLRRSLTMTRGYFNFDPSVGKRGVNKRSRNMYKIQTTLSKDFDNQNKSRTWRGRSFRYPFAVEAGVKPQKYARFSPEPNRTLHIVNRKAPRNPQRYQHSALGAQAGRVVNVWAKRMGHYIGLYARTRYKTLRTASSAYIAGRGTPKGNKWID